MQLTNDHEGSSAKESISDFTFSLSLAGYFNQAVDWEKLLSALKTTACTYLKQIAIFTHSDNPTISDMNVWNNRDNRTGTPSSLLNSPDQSMLHDFKYISCHYRLSSIWYSEDIYSTACSVNIKVALLNRVRVWDWFFRSFLNSNVFADFLLTVHSKKHDFDFGLSQILSWLIRGSLSEQTGSGWIHVNLKCKIIESIQAWNLEKIDKATGHCIRSTVWSPPTLPGCIHSRSMESVTGGYKIIIWSTILIL